MASVWTGDPARGHRPAARIKAGTVGINMPYTAFPGLPFGGYKQSGFGRELGIETLDLYLETKSVTVNTGFRPINPSLGFPTAARSRFPVEHHAGGPPSTACGGVLSRVHSAAMNAPAFLASHRGGHPTSGWPPQTGTVPR